jgi:hypothetical protein
MRQPRHCRLAACRIHFGAIRFYSLGHGGNDAQKTMGIIAVPAVLAGLSRCEVPLSVLSYNHLSDRDDAGNAGWWLAHREDNGVQDYAYADARLLRGTEGAATLFVSTWLGILVSTTRTSPAQSLGWSGTKDFFSALDRKQYCGGLDHCDPASATITATCYGLTRLADGCNAMSGGVCFTPERGTLVGVREMFSVRQCTAPPNAKTSRIELQIVPL